MDPPGQAISCDVLILVVALVASAADAFKKRVPLWVPLGLAFFGLTAHSAFWGLGEGLEQGALASLFGILAALMVFGVFWLWKTVEARDVWLMAALSAAAGLLHALACMMRIALVGAALGLALLLVSSRRWLVLRGMFRLRKKQDNERLELPYGHAMLAGAIWATLARHGLIGF